MSRIPPTLEKAGIRRLEDNRDGREVAASPRAFMTFFGDLLEERFIHRTREDTSRGPAPADPVGF